MRKSFNFRGVSLKGVSVSDPRVVMRAVIGVLLAANLGAAVWAFKPFGGSADDLRNEQRTLTAQLTQLQARLAASQRLVNKVQAGRKDGDGFLGKYFMDEPTTSATIVQALYDAAKEAGVTMGPAQWERMEIEGSDSLMMLSTQVGFQGTYANLTKFVHLVDISPRFMIVENLQAAAPQQQGGQNLNVTLKIDTFVRVPGAVS